MANIDPCILDTLEFSGLSESEMRQKATASRDGLVLFEHELAFVRSRVVGRDPNKPSLIVLPDGPATIESYDAFIDQLSEAFNIAIVETPGLGFSFPKSAEALEFEHICQITLAAIAELDLPRVVLVGPCVQGLVAARMAEVAPQRFAGLIIAQTGDFPSAQIWSGQSLDAKGNLARPFEGQISFRLARERATLDWWTELAAGPHLPMDLFQSEARNVMQSGSCYALASILQKWNKMDPPPSLQPNIPTSVIWGMCDPSHAQTDKRSLLKNIPHARYCEHEDLGHFPDIEAPNRIGEAALELISK